MHSLVHWARTRATIFAAFVLTVFSTPAFATDALVYSFVGSPSATAPEFGLTSNGDVGYLYGVTQGGGATNKGAFYRIKLRSGKPAFLQLLYSFKGGAAGERPNGALVADDDGNLYGVAVSGGVMSDCGGLGCGVVYQLRAPQPGHSAWAYKVIWRFHHTRGSSPVGRLTFDAAKQNLYGVTQYGGSDNFCTGDMGGCGGIFRLTRPAMDGDPWTFTKLHDFAHAMGAVPNGGLAFKDDESALYGTTLGGGTSPLDGVLFQLRPPAPGKVKWRYKVIYNFQGTANSDGSLPNGDLFVNDSDQIIGTTQAGGTTNSGVCPSGCGTVFLIEPQGMLWQKTDLHFFTGGSDGRLPMSGVIFNGSAHLVGTTRFGGGAACGIGCGTVFSVTGGGSYLKWHAFPSFGTPNDGLQPLNGPLLLSGSNFYATTAGGGVNNLGAVISINTAPPP